jgi:D-galactose 1-dehydrogenase
MDLSRTIRLSTIGLGNVADYHLEALKQQNQFVLVAACDSDESKQKKLLEYSPNTKFFTSYEEMLKTVSIDAVLVASSNHTHYEIAKKVLDSGKNLLLEKPATSNLAELEDLVNRAKMNNLVFVVAFHDSFAKEVRWFLNSYQQQLYKDLGPITGFECGFYDPYILEGKLQEKAKSLGSSWLDSGINALSVIAKLVESLAVIEKRHVHIPSYPVGDIQSSVDFAFSIDGKEDSAGRGLIETNWCLGYSRKVTNLYFAISKNQVILHHSNQQVLLIDKQMNKTVLADFSSSTPRLTDQYADVFNDFYSHLVSFSNNLDFAWGVHQLLLAEHS